MPGAKADGSAATSAERGRAARVLNLLVERYPESRTALDYTSPWRLLVATVLSAQTTDETVNRVVVKLFDRYPDLSDLAEADPEEVEQIIFSTGFYRQKTRSIIKLAEGIEEMYGGDVPADLDLLVKLPGVGRKTASVVLAEVWNIPAIAVDTHVKRIVGRLGLSAQHDPDKIESDLKALFSERKWSGVSMRFIQFGRDICDAKRPKCESCELFDLCEWPDRIAIAARARPE